MRLMGAFLSHELTTQFRSTRFRVLALAYAVIAAIPVVAIYLASRTVGYLLGSGAYAQALRMLQPSLTALLATVLAVDAITRERDEGSFGVVALAPVSNSGYVFRRWLALLTVALPLTVVPTIFAASLAAHADRRMPDLAPLAWDWLLHVAPPLVVMSALMLALGTITGRTILAILACAFAMTFGLGFLQDALAYAHRHLEGPGAMIGFDPLSLARLVWTLRGWWQLDPPTAAGYAIEDELDALWPQAALLLGCTCVCLGVAPAFLRRTRPDVRPWRIRDDHPLRTMLRGINRMRENYTPDAGLQAVDRMVMLVAVIASIVCFTLLVRRDTRFIELARQRYAAEVAGEPREMSATLVARAIRIEGDAGRTIRTRATFEFENGGTRAEHRLAFALHPGLEIERVATTCGHARVTRRWERIGLDLDRPLAASATCTVTFDVGGSADAPVFNFSGKGRFGERYRQWERGTTSIELSDLSRSSYQRAVTRRRMILGAADLAPVPRYTPWRVDESYVDVDTSSFVPENVAVPSDLRVSLRIPDGFTAIDSCGSTADKQLTSRCALPLTEYGLAAARYTTMPLGRATLMHLPPHAGQARAHAPAIAEAITAAERAWPGLRLGGAPVFVEKPAEGEANVAFFRRAQNAPMIYASGSMFFIPEEVFIQRKPFESQRVAAAIISSTLRDRRVLAPEERGFFLAFFNELARARTGTGDSRTAVIGGRGPRPSTEPLLTVTSNPWGGHGMTRLRGVLVDLEYRAGAARVVEAVNEFLDRPGTGTARELVDTIARRANIDLDGVYRDYFAGEALPKLTIEDAAFVRDGRRWIVRGFARNLASGESIVPMVLRTQFGSVRQVVTVGANARVPFELVTEHEPRTLQLDPDRVVYRHAAVGTVDSIDFKGQS